MSDIFNLTDTWNNGATVFTAVKMNVTDAASDAASKVLDLQVGGTTVLSIRKDGHTNLSGSGLSRFDMATSGANIGLSFRGNDGTIILVSGGALKFNSNATQIYGGSEDGAIERQAPKVLKVSDAAGGAGALRLPAFTVATLPAAATAGVGARATVSDALAPSFGATVAAGGAVVTPVYSDGTNWKVG